MKLQKKPIYVQNVKKLKKKKKNREKERTQNKRTHRDIELGEESKKQRLKK